MAKPTGRNITVDALNERRLKAVKLRLSGVSVADTAVRAGLSQPTVIDAFKAYTAAAGARCRSRHGEGVLGNGE